MYSEQWSRREATTAINQIGTAVLLIEQNAHAALKVAQRGYVIESGCVTVAGPADQLREDPQIVEAYLGA
ncbi:hypothetical protein [Streptomyces arenae]|uniref:hypothetical protein n=1 Tax=Streptomyces arenae TaxID=29301 RepID=UPI003D2D30AB